MTSLNFVIPMIIITAEMMQMCLKKFSDGNYVKIDIVGN